MSADDFVLWRKTMTRRRALAVGGGGIAGGLLVLTGCSSDSKSKSKSPASSTTSTTLAPIDPPAGSALVEPPELVSENGVLAATLTAAVGSAMINGAEVAGVTTYNGVWPAPTMRVQPGDTFRINLVNETTGATNLHWHGFHVSPQGNSDNVFLHLDPETSQAYEVQIPADHPSGLYWYHPHNYPNTDPQVWGGLAGAIVVEGGHDTLPGIAGAPQHLVLLKDAILTDDGSELGTEFMTGGTQIFTVNGQINPRLEARPAETHLWRVGNLGSQTFYDLSLEGQQLHIVAIDGSPLPELMTVDHHELVPGSRVEFLVNAAEAGTYKFKSSGAQSMGYPEATLATLEVAGVPVTDGAPLPTTLVALTEDLRDAAVDKERTLTFSVTGNGDATRFLINGEEFDHNKINETVKLNAMEEWKLVNTDTGPHPFHIHQNDFQVMSINGKPVEEVHYNDTISIPAQGEVVIRQRYTDFTGKWVYHCHILYHEDHGMMGTVRCEE